MRLTRIRRRTVEAKLNADRHAHREAAYRLHLCQEQLESLKGQVVNKEQQMLTLQSELERCYDKCTVSVSELAMVNTAIEKLSVLITEAGLSLYSIDVADAELMERGSDVEDEE